MRRTDFGLIEAIVVFALFSTVTIWANAAAVALGVTLPEVPLFKKNYLLFAFTLAVLVWVRLRGDSWSHFGLMAPRWRHLGYGMLVLVAMLAYSPLAQTYVDPWIASWAGSRANNTSAYFAPLRGNLPLLLMLLPLTWLFAAFGEEVLFRGYFMTRVAEFMGRTPVAWAIALIVQAIAFGAAHAYLGPAGMLNAAVLGAISGVATLAFGRNLWPAIVAHGLLDTMGLTMLYLGANGN